MAEISTDIRPSFITNLEEFSDHVCFKGKKDTPPKSNGNRKTTTTTSSRCTVFPVKNGDFPASHVNFVGGGIFQTL